MNQQMDRNEYMDERRLLAGLEAESSRSFDKALLTFSSGAIALSVTFIEKFNSGDFSCLLIVSWILWLASIVFQVLSYFVSAKAMREELTILNEQYKDCELEPRKNKYTGWPTKLNLTSLTSFLVGTIIFLFFVIQNFNK
jgi:hypothetical protein